MNIEKVLSIVIYMTVALCFVYFFGCDPEKIFANLPLVIVYISLAVMIFYSRIAYVRFIVRQVKDELDKK